MNIKQIAKAAHEVNRTFCQQMNDDSQVAWEDAPEWQRESCIAGVEYKLTHSDAKPSDQHEQWLKLKEKEGWIYGKIKDAKLKEHPCFVRYEDLPPEQKAKGCKNTSLAKSAVNEPTAPTAMNATPQPNQFAGH